MRSFNEELLHFIWKHRLLKPVKLTSVSGADISIVQPGEHNHDAGPDFSRAQIRVNNLLLVGNVEIHIKTSDWLRHDHQHDAGFDKIILHAVYEHDLQLTQNTEFGVEVLELKNLIDPETLIKYETLATTGVKIPCHKHLPHVPDFHVRGWLQRMAIERLQQKVNLVSQVFSGTGSDYSATLYICLFRNFGFKVNNLPFELLGRALPLNILARHSDQPEHLEALLFGMAGMLNEQYEDEYLRRLQNEFEFQRSKYNLVPLQKHLFKFSRMRPANFPSVRLAQLAMLIHTNKKVFSSPASFPTYEEIVKMLNISAGDHWKFHHLPGCNMICDSYTLGIDSIENLIINTFAPFFFFYGEQTGQLQFRDAALELLEACKAENNAKTRMFGSRQNIGLSAADSQGMINLYDNYCLKKQCLNCGIGASILGKHSFVKFVV